jgi:hypothetical protein
MRPRDPKRRKELIDYLKKGIIKVLRKKPGCTSYEILDRIDYKYQLSEGRIVSCINQHLKDKVTRVKGRRNKYYLITSARPPTTNEIRDYLIAYLEEKEDNQCTSKEGVNYLETVTDEEYVPRRIGIILAHTEGITSIPNGKTKIFKLETLDNILEK